MQKQNRLNPKINKRINIEFSRLLDGRYFEMVPISEIMSIMEQQGVVLLQEDDTRFEGFISGREGRASINVGDINNVDDDGVYVQFTNSMLILTWYKMEETGRFEVVAYLS